MGIVEVDGVSKVYRNLITSTGFSEGDMWLDYVLGILLGRGRKVFRPDRSEITALSNVSFQIEEGEFFGIIGANGAGKSTLIKSIATLLLPTTGRIRVCGYDTIKQGRQVREKIAVARSGGWVGFDYELSVFENLVFWGKISGIPADRIKKLVLYSLEAVGLSEKANESPGALSSGMRQKMVLAKGLASNAQVFLLDEPTTGLDPISAYQIRSLIKEVLNRRWGKTVVYTSHNLSDVESLCDRICLLDKGKVLLIGSPRDIIARSSVRVKTVLIRCTGFDGRPNSLGLPANSTSVVSGSEDTFVLRVRSTDNGLLANVETILSQAGATVLKSREEPATLEDAFWVITGRDQMLET